MEVRLEEGGFGGGFGGGKWRDVGINFRRWDRGVEC